MAKDLSKEEEAKTIADLLKESDEAYTNKLTQLKEEKPVLDNSEYNLGTHIGTALQGLGNYISKRGGATPSSTVGSLYSDVNKKRADEFATLLKEWESQKEALRDEHKNNMTKIGLIAKHTKTPEEIEKARLGNEHTQSQIDKNNRWVPKSSSTDTSNNVNVNLPNGQVVSAKPGSVASLLAAGGTIVGTPELPEDTVPKNKVTEAIAKEQLKPENRNKIEQDENRLNRQVELYPKIKSDMTGFKKIATGISEILGRDPGAPFAPAAAKLAIDQLALSPEQKEFMWLETQKAYSQVKDTVGGSGISNADVAGLMSLRMSILDSDDMFAQDVKRQRETNEANRNTYNSYARAYAPNLILEQRAQPTSTNSPNPQQPTTDKASKWGLK